MNASNIVRNDTENDTMTREEFMAEREEMGLNINPQSDDTEEYYESGFTNSCTFNFILECDNEIFNDFQTWALPLLNATTVAEEAIQQCFLGDLDLNSSCYFSDIEIFNIWFYKTNRVVYWICKDRDVFELISDKFSDFSSTLDAMGTPAPVTPFFCYGSAFIKSQVFFINAPFVGLTQSIEQHTILYPDDIHASDNNQGFLDKGDDSTFDEMEEDDDGMSNWDMNNQDISINDL